MGGYRDQLVRTATGSIVATVIGTMASTACAQSTPAEVRALINPAITIANTAPLNFGRVSAGVTAGNVSIAAGSGARSRTGGVTLLAGPSGRASFIVNGRPGGRVRITNQAAPITLTRVGGGATMLVDRLTLQGARNRNLNGAGQATVNFGGRLRVAAGQQQGLYSGTFTVTVDYL